MTKPIAMKVNARISDTVMTPELAVSTAERSKAMPEVPTMAESGVADFDVFAWQALAVPAGTSQPIVNRLNDALTKALNNPEVQKRMKEAGMEPLPGKPDQLDALVAADKNKWSALLRSLNIRLD